MKFNPKEFLEYLYLDMNDRERRNLYFNQPLPVDQDRPRPDERVYVLANDYRQFERWCLENLYKPNRSAFYVDHYERILPLRRGAWLIDISSPGSDDMERVMSIVHHARACGMRIVNGKFVPESKWR